MIEKITNTYGKNAQNKSSIMSHSSYEGVLAALETFYYSFNNKDINVFKELWVENELIQLNNPVGGMLRGKSEIVNLYNNIFTGKADVWVEFSDIVCYAFNDCYVFTGREQGEFKIDNKTINLKIRTSRIFAYVNGKWGQVHHHGSIDDAALLAKYQDAVKA